MKSVVCKPVSLTPNAINFLKKKKNTLEENKLCTAAIGTVGSNCSVGLCLDPSATGQTGGSEPQWDRDLTCSGPLTCSDLQKRSRKLHPSIILESKKRETEPKVMIFGGDLQICDCTKLLLVELTDYEHQKSQGERRCSASSQASFKVRLLTQLKWFSRQGAECRGCVRVVMPPDRGHNEIIQNMTLSHSFLLLLLLWSRSLGGVCASGPWGRPLATM